MEDKEEKLCIKVLQTLKEMMTVDVDYGDKVRKKRMMSQRAQKDARLLTSSSEFIIS